jgi:hypothetical protein
VKQHFSRFRDEKHALIFAVGEVFLADAARVAAAEVHLLARTVRSLRDLRLIRRL